MAGLDKLAHLDRWQAAARVVDRRARRRRRVERIVVVTPAERVAEVCEAPWLSRRVVAVVTAGRDATNPWLPARGPRGARRRRFAAATGVVLVHDGARPPCRRSWSAPSLAAASEHGAAIPVLP